jgi:long-chain acyl-CoA synthetase
MPPVAGHDADRIAIRCGQATLTYGELADRTAALAAGLLDAGLRPGDRLALFMPNCPELVLAYRACFATGIIAVALNTRYRAREVDYALERSTTEAMIVHPDLTRELPSGSYRRWVADPDGAAWRELFDSAPRSRPTVDPRAPALILFTSGSTSLPKGVTHSQASMAHTVATQRAVQELTADDVNLITLATCHIAGLFGQLLPTLDAGGTCVLHAHFDAATAAQEIERSRVTRIQTLPAQLAELLDTAAGHRHDLSSLRCAIVGGDVLPLDVHAEFSRVTGLQATEVCGMTECFDYAMNPPFGEKRLGSIGRPPPGTELRLDNAGGAPAVGAPGEILVRSAGTMIGYWQDPEHTDAVLSDGWLRTGDIGRVDEDGWYWFVSRTKELIIRGGSNVAPGEVEAVVVGVPDDHLGQRIAAWVQLHHGAVADAAELRNYLAARIAAYKVPEWVWIEPSLPTTSVGKFDRHLLQERAAARTASSHA